MKNREQALMQRHELEKAQFEIVNQVIKINYAIKKIEEEQPMNVDMQELH